MTRSALVFDRVTRRFPRKTALDELSFTVEPGTVLGLLGRNGAGKTTALPLEEILVAYLRRGGVEERDHV